MKTKRSSGFEVLRIISMIQIIILHVYTYGGFDKLAKNAGGNFLVGSNLFWSFCRSPVNVFVMLTGYFLVTSEFDLKKSYKRIGSTYAVMIFYSLSLNLLSYILEPELFALPPDKLTYSILGAFMPFLSRRWYFLTLYILVCLLAPFINIILKNLNKNQYLILLGICFFTVSVWPVLATCEPTKNWIGINKIIDVEQGKSLVSFLLMYMIGGFLRRFSVSKNRPQLKYLFAYIALCLIDFALDYYFTGSPKSYPKVFGWFSNPLVVMEAVSLIMFFKDFKFKSSIINAISSTTIGIYAIHEFPFVRKLIWEKFNFLEYNFEKGWMYFANMIFVALIVFVVCGLIEFIRKQIFNGAGFMFRKIIPNNKKS